MKSYILLLGFLLSSCFIPSNDDPGLPISNLSVDKLLLPAEKFSRSADWKFCEGIDVDLSYYDNIDSIVFVPNLRSQSAEKKCIAALYNYTLDQDIAGSRVESKVNYVLHLVRSRNLKNSFSSPFANLGIKFRSSEEGHHVEIGVDSHVLIYYH